MSGPKLEIVARCTGCDWLRETMYCQTKHFDWEKPGSVMRRECAHPASPQRVGAGALTPESCPLLPAARAAFVAGLVDKNGNA